MNLSLINYGFQAVLAVFRRWVSWLRHLGLNLTVFQLLTRQVQLSLAGSHLLFEMAIVTIF